MIQSISTRKPYDTAIIGGGILGLWAARHAIKRGERVVLVEKRQIGAGASGGFLGALMPHMPDNWNAKKQFQFEGLNSLPRVIAELEADTGMDCGYRRCGRIMPVTNEKLLGQIERRIKGAEENWQGQYAMTLLSNGRREQAQGETRSAEPHPELVEGWINPEIATFGIQHDTLAARVNPRAYIAALEAYVRPRCEVLENAEALTLRQAQGEVYLINRDTITASKIIVANGWESYSLLQPFMGAINENRPIGRGVKGQAVLLEFEHKDDLPIVYHDGAYVVPHARNRVAVGSTSVNDWSGDPNAFDPNDMGFYEKAIELVPALKDAPIIDRWAAVRPRNTLEGRGTSPWFGPVPEHDNLSALVGGFKITLGVGHLDFSTNKFTE